MAAPSYTYSLTNGATADAAQVMQNYNDILNGVTDGTKDLTINALTCNGAVSLKGTVTLGDATADDITVTGSLASTIAIKTTNTYNIGSATLGLAGVYFGTGSTQTARIVATGTLASSRTYTLLDAGAAANVVLSEGTATINGTKTFGGQLIAKGTATNDSAAAGYMGEYFVNNKSTDLTVTTVTSGNAFDIDSSASVSGGTTISATGIALTAGDWDISGSVYFETATSTVSLLSAWFGTVAGNDTTGRDLSSNYIALDTVATTGGQAFALPTFRVSLSGNQSYYLKGRMGYTVAGTLLARGSIHARRVR